MKKAWERPVLEVLEVKQTKKGFSPPWDWEWKDKDHDDDDQGNLFDS